MLLGGGLLVLVAETGRARCGRGLGASGAERSSSDGWTILDLGVSCLISDSSVGISQWS